MLIPCYKNSIKRNLVLNHKHVGSFHLQNLDHYVNKTY